jgi:very-short-patch-repair endonuclease
MRKDVSPERRGFAKTLRSNSTDAERKLWSMLRAGRIDGLKFKRQLPVDGYVLDFVCHEAKLIIEADGGQHSDSSGDRVRAEHFAEAGYLTLRFWNNDILTNPQGVHQRITAILAGRSPPKS